MTANPLVPLDSRWRWDRRKCKPFTIKWRLNFTRSTEYQVKYASGKGFQVSEDELLACAIRVCKDEREAALCALQGLKVEVQA